MSPTHVDAIEFERAVNSFYEPLYRFALSLAHSTADACDLTQQTFFRLASKGHLLRDRSKVKSWLFTTLYREYLGTRRRSTRFPHCDLEAAGNELPTISPASVNTLDGGSVMEALRAVDEIYRAPLTLFYMEDHSYAEIAKILGVPIGTVMSRLSRGKTLLRRMLSDRVSEGENKLIALDQFDAARKKL